jgi:hypothetical protein
MALLKEENHLRRRKRVLISGKVVNQIMNP